MTCIIDMCLAVAFASGFRLKDAPKTRIIISLVPKCQVKIVSRHFKRFYQKNDMKQLKSMIIICLLYIY
jgi:hypothetical protein